MLKISHLPGLIFQNKRNIAPKTVTIVRKNNRDYIKSEFVGYYAQRPNPLEFITDLFEKFFLSVK